MERRNSANSGMGIWVVEYDVYQDPPQSSWLVTVGLTLGGHSSSEDSKIRHLSGDVVLISNGSRTIKEVSLTKLHVSGLGFPWLIEGADYLPDKPFLISLDLSAKTIFDGYVKLSEEENIISMTEPDDEGYSVSAKNWFGIIMVEEHSQLRLTAFSSDENASVLENEDLWSFDYDSRVGKIDWISKTT
jgi:hypothetical protein